MSTRRLATAVGITETLAVETVAPSAGKRRHRDLTGLKYLGKRLGTYAVVAVVSLFASFVLPRMIPGNPAEQMIQSIIAKTGQRPSPFALQQIYDRYGDPHQNLFVAFFDYCVQTLHGDFGLSIQYYPLPVGSLIAGALPWTIYLALASTIVGWLIGTYLGARLGWRPGRKLDSILTPFSMFFSSIPAFWLGLLLVWYVSYKNGWMPNQGAYNEALGQPNLLNPLFVISALYYSVLPMVTLVVVGFSHWMFTMRNMMITTVNEDYVQLARAKGLRQSAVRNRYAARNALLPNFTGLAQSIGGSLTAVILAETVFLYPGVGTLLTQAQGSRDYPVMQAVMLLVIAFTLAFNFIADSVYVLLDPRTREQ
jgi:ABC-type dipeptide/oligopeptide/nickel transport systems, permease components